MPRVAALLLGLMATAAGQVAAGEREISVAVDAAVTLERCEIVTTERLRVRNDGGETLDHLPLRAFADRFREEPALDDLARHHLLSGSTYRAGGVEIRSVTVGGRAVADDVTSVPASASVVKVPLGLASGGTAEIAVELVTRLPSLRDVFGCDERLLVAAGGWMLVPLGPTGAPAAHDLRAEVRIPAGSEALLGGRFARSPEALSFEGPAEALGPLVVSSIPFESRRWRAGNRRIVLHTLPRADVVQRSGLSPTPEDALAEALRAIVARSAATEDLTLVRLPLGWLPSYSSPEATLFSDRLFEILVELRPLHVRELAYAVFLGEEIALARRREAARDVGWIAEGLAWRRAQELYATGLRHGREVREWIDLFGVFAIVDRFETAPRIPLLRPFFPVLASDDPQGLRPETGLDERPPGRVLFSKLENRLRTERFAERLDAYRRGTRSFRDELGAEESAFVDAWLRPAPNIDYRLLSVERDGSRVRVRVAREGEAAPDETVEVAVGDRRVPVDLAEGAAAVEVEAEEGGETVELDPDRELLQESLEGDRDPPGVQVLLDSADVEVSSTEFGFSTLFVARRKYDYRKDLAAAAFINDRAYGLHSGFQLHGGKAIDRNLFRDNLFLYYAVEELERGFGEDRDDAPRAGGRLSGFGLRYNHFDSFWFENPSRSRHVRLFLDGYDRSLGSRYGFVRTGGSLAVTHAVRPDTIAALQLIAGFTLRTGDRSIPPQGLYGIGGFRAIRGIGADDDLDRHLAVVRAEIRRLLPFRLDLDLDEIVIARRLQVKAFVDAGRVARDAGRVFDVSEFAVGAGAGVNLFYDFLGFFPTSFYLDVATRVDRRDSVQVLFGARQPF
ncbi:MAG: hypothetical protein ACREQJ_04825 [Candidatus Binatia bacterium]